MKKNSKLKYSEFKPIKPRLEIHLASHPSRAEGLTKHFLRDTSALADSKN